MWWVEALDVIFGLLILADFTARLAISQHRLRDLLHPATWADLVAILSFLAPLAGEAGGFLRVLRTLRPLQTYTVLARLRTDSPCFDKTRSWRSPSCFLFVMTGIVYETQHWANPEIRNYVDAPLLHRDGNRRGILTQVGNQCSVISSAFDFQLGE
jgi:voltage-gated potassium channel